VFDYIISTPALDTFVTLTLDCKKIDRYDYDVIIKKFNTWLDNSVRRRGLSYVLVPEHHRDGAVHFHGFMSSSALSLVDSGISRNNQTVYNIQNYSFGFSTAIIIDNSPQVRLKVSKYMWKYVTKQLNGVGDVVGGRFYLHGGKLNKPRFEYKNTLGDEVEGDTITVEGGVSIKVWREIL
jgi:hypothetical protein